MAFAVIVTLLVLIATLWYFLRRPKHPVDQLPGPPTLPVFGNIFTFLKPKGEVFAAFNECAKKYFPIYRTWIGNVLPIIHPLGPQYVESVLTSSLHITKSHDYDFVTEWLGTGLLTSKGAKWHSRRKLLTPAFHFTILEQFVPIFCDKSRILISKMRNHVDNKNGVDIVPLVTRCALDIICETAMGHSLNAQENVDSDYVTSIYLMGDLFVHRVLRPWLYPGWIFRLSPTGRQFKKCLKVLHGFTKKVIQERRKELRNSNKDLPTANSDDDVLKIGGTKKKTAFLDLLLRVSEEQGNLTDEDIREEVDTFMFEGHDTTAMAMSWALYFLSAHPNIQEKCVEELKMIFEGTDRAASLSDLNNMKYLERVIKETLRLRPSVITIARTLDTPLTLDGFDDFPPKTCIHLNIYNVHRNPEIFPEPEKFDPDRFLPENCVGRHPYAYIPFSAGPRNCIGQKFAMLEMKSLLSTVLRNFRLESCDPEKYYEAVPDIILRPKNGLQTRIFTRGS